MAIIHQMSLNFEQRSYGWQTLIKTICFNFCNAGTAVDYKILKVNKHSPIIKLGSSTSCELLYLQKLKLKEEFNPAISAADR